MKLSARLKTVTELVNQAAEDIREPLCVADIGTDHGYLAVELKDSGTAERVVASDINEGPLERAREHIKDREDIELRISDGLAAYSAGEVNAAVMAGMGGRLIERIIREGRPDKLGIKELVLQPQSEIYELRVFLRESGYITADERMVKDSGRFYTAMRVIVPLGQNGRRPAERDIAGNELGLDIDESVRTRLFDRFGQKLLSAGDRTLAEYLTQRIVVLENVIKSVPSGNSERLGELGEELDDTRRAYEIIENNRTA